MSKILSTIHKLLIADQQNTILWKTGGGWGKVVPTLDPHCPTPDDFLECQTFVHCWERYTYSQDQCSVCEKIISIPREPRF